MGEERILVCSGNFLVLKKNDTSQPSPSHPAATGGKEDHIVKPFNVTSVIFIFHFCMEYAVYKILYSVHPKGNGMTNKC